jgi:ribokinase
MESAAEAAKLIRQRGVETVIITLGEKGALVLHEEELTHVPTITVKAVDTTAAGDVFNGALAVTLAEGALMQEAVAFACKAAALSVTKLGAQASAPYRQEVDNLPAGASSV